MDVTDPSEVVATPEAGEAVGGAHRGESDETAWPWDVLRAEQQAVPGSFTDVIRHELRWDAAAFALLEDAMRAACAELDDQSTIERWVGEGFWVWTAVVPELTQHPRFSSPDPHYLRRCLARLRDLGSWFFNGTSPYGPDHDWTPVA